MTRDGETTDLPPVILRCAACGEGIRPGRAPGTYSHRARVVASCDLDADHRALPAPATEAPEGAPKAH